MSDDILGMEIEDAEVDEQGNTVLKRKDITPFVNAVTTLISAGPGKKGKVTVQTGERSKRGNRGKSELSDAKTLQEIANGMGHGLKVTYRHLNDGTTILYMAVVPKRTFTDEQIANREKGQNKRRLELAKVRLTKANQLLAVNPNNEDAKEKAAEATARINELNTILNGAPKKPAAKVTK